MRVMINEPLGKIKRLLSLKWVSINRMQFLMYAIFGIAYYLLLINHVLPEQYDIQLGDASPQTISSPVNTIDKYATSQAKQAAAEAVEPVYVIDEQIKPKQIERIERIIQGVREVNKTTLPDEEKKVRFRVIFKDAMDQSFSEGFYQTLLEMNDGQLTKIRKGTIEIISQIFENGVKESNLEESKQKVDAHLSNKFFAVDGLDRNAASIVSELSKRSVIVNSTYNEEKTNERRQVAQDNIKSVVIDKGQLIVAKGEQVTEDQYRKLSELGLLKNKLNIVPYIGLALFIFLLLIFLHVYVNRFHPKIYDDNTGLLLFFSVLMLTLIGMKFVTIGQNAEWSTIGYIAPVGLAAMLITLLLNIELALAAAVWIGLSASMMYNGDTHLLFDFRFGLVAVVNGVTGAFALASVRRRSNILIAGIIASITSTLAIVSMYLMVPTQGSWEQTIELVGFGLISGMLSAVLTIGFLPYFETLFGILSPLRLLELSNPNHPLLRKLLIEAPGTYHHSIIVGNLAETAAEAVGADGLLSRVGAYYHDLGKTKRPQFFIENQIFKDNPHDKISAQLSKTIIVSHTKDGVALLRHYKLPKPLQDIVMQHHGTTLIKYFYYKALNQEKDGKQVVEEDFRYPGPKPQFKEAAIVGICDCVEAAVRSLAKPTPKRIENLVRKIIRERLDDGQFDECDLTFKELDQIAIAICETLQGIFHNRIEYPDEPKKVKGEQ
ncbi:HD family phosphohydrolase [Hazenella sp. IB182353]|uniref:HD family phosphohydrolase n=1 Tax=Polycladospora coralii TaxID=2771432 RepID=UPI0017472566|nr:HD family phosphohydrolase [Polycladospora coralii]MBS7530109.1 HD family phosphohydrolase [Polycladospora coralii]